MLSTRTLSLALLALSAASASYLPPGTPECCYQVVNNLGLPGYLTQGCAVILEEPEDPESTLLGYACPEVPSFTPQITYVNDGNGTYAPFNMLLNAVFDGVQFIGNIQNLLCDLDIAEVFEGDKVVVVMQGAGDNSEFVLQPKSCALRNIRSNDLDMICSKYVGPCDAAALYNWPFVGPTKADGIEAADQFASLFRAAGTTNCVVARYTKDVTGATLFGIATDETDPSELSKVTAPWVFYLDTQGAVRMVPYSPAYSHCSIACQRTEDRPF